jgi:hypothetical protein
VIDADAVAPMPDEDGAAVLDALEEWFGRFVCVSFDGDLALLALWTEHTHLAKELRTTPRLQLDSPMPESGKTTVLDHFSRLCRRPIQIASPPSQALIPRMLERAMRTVLLDEVDRILRPDSPSSPDLFAILNSGYRVGATRPVLMPAPGGWEAREMSTFAPVAMAGNAPNLPDDTRSRMIRVLLMPDRAGTAEDSDWEYIEDDAKRLRTRIEAFADAVRENVAGMAVDLPAGCIGRMKEKWRPLKRVAVAAGGRWPAVVDALIERDLAEIAAEREAGLRTLPPGMVVLADLAAVWTDAETFMPTRRMVERLTYHNPDYWGKESPYGKQLTEVRLGRLLAQAAKVTPGRIGGAGPRGYLRAGLEPAWRQLGIPSGEPGEPGELGEAGDKTNDDNRLNRLNRVNRLRRDTPTPSGGKCDMCGRPLETPESIEAGMCRECRFIANNETTPGAWPAREETP